MSTLSFPGDIGDFLKEVEKRPVIWDLNSRENKEKTLREKAWMEVAKKFIENFDDIPDLQKLNLCKKLESKWRNFRDNYVRWLRKPSTTKPYAYADDLKFLQQLYLNRRGKYEKTIDDDMEETASSSDEDLSMVVAKRRRREPVKSLAPHQEVSSSSPDEDRMFFESLLPAVREFDMDQKLEFRTNVLQLIKTIRDNARRDVSIDVKKEVIML